MSLSGYGKYPAGVPNPARCEIFTRSACLGRSIFTQDNSIRFGMIPPDPGLTGQNQMAVHIVHQ